MKYALIIGNSEYDDDKLVQLKAPAVDSRRLANILSDKSIGAFDVVIPLVNQTDSEIRRAITVFLTNKKIEDLVLIYFSGHGILDERGRLCLALKDTMIGILTGTSIPSAFIVDELDRCRSKRQVLILDCCNSGAFERGKRGGKKVVTEKTFEGNGYGRVVLTASDSLQLALEGNQVVDQTDLSLFTHFLIDGLQTGNADSDGDGDISLDEWYEYAYEKTLDVTSEQVPQKWSYRQQGKLIIAKNPFTKEEKQKSELKRLENQVSNFELAEDFESALQVYYELKRIDFTFPNIDTKIKELEQKIELRNMERRAFQFETGGNLNAALQVYYDIRQIAPFLSRIDVKIKELEQILESKNLESKAAQLEAFGNFENALQIYYDIRKINPLFPDVNAKIKDLEQKVELNSLEGKASHFELLGDINGALQVYYDIRKIDPLFLGVDIKIKKLEQDIEIKKLESQAIQCELKGDFWSARKTWYAIKQINPLFPRVDIKIRELEREVAEKTALREMAERESVKKAEIEAERRQREQAVQKKPISIFIWNLTLSPIVFVALILIGFSQKIFDSLQGFGGLVIIIPTTIIISIVQWFLLRRLFPGASRWVGINTIYVVIIAFLTILFLAGALANNPDQWLLMFISFFMVLSFWLFPNYYIGYLISIQNITINNFFAKQGSWNISFWIKWISTPLLGLLGTVIIFALLFNPLNSWLSSNTIPSWIPTWFGSSLVFGVWGGLTGLFQWLILRNRLRNFRWLILAYIVIGAIPWGDTYNIIVGIIFVFWILFSLVLALILAWKQDQRKEEAKRRIALKPIDARIVIGTILILFGIGAWVISKNVLVSPAASELSLVSAQATSSSLQNSKIKTFGPDTGEIIHNPGDNVLKFASSGVALRNFIVEVQINNPSNNEVAWSYAIDFRETYLDDALYLNLNSDQTWSLQIDKKGRWSELSGGTLNNLNVSASGSNKVRLVVYNNLAFFYINDVFVSTLDVSDNQLEGDVAIVVRQEIAGEKTSYENFTVWSIDNSSPKTSVK